MVWAFDVADAPPGFARRYFQAALERGLLLRPIGNTVYFMPPYVLTANEQQLLADAALSALDSVL
jgi:adenosylmethionine-8-amino-7-oxononanoate aminotransferase